MTQSPTLTRNLAAAQEAATLLVSNCWFRYQMWRLQPVAVYVDLTKVNR